MRGLKLARLFLIVLSTGTTLFFFGGALYTMDTNILGQMFEGFVLMVIGLGLGIYTFKQFNKFCVEKISIATAQQGNIYHYADTRMVAFTYINQFIYLICTGIATGMTIVYFARAIATSI